METYNDNFTYEQAMIVKHIYNDKRRCASKKRRRKALYKRMIILLLMFITFVGLGLYKAHKNGMVLGSASTDMILKNYPFSLVELYEKNPDARNFVMDYDQYKGKHFEIDITDDVNEGGIPLFLQWDKRWGYEKYGSDMMAITGCGPTSLSMVYSGLTGATDINPYTLAKKAESEGYYVAGSGTSWNMMSDMASELGLAVYYPGNDADSIAAELSVGHPIICIMGPGDFTSSGHFIVLTAIDEDGMVTVNDPNSTTNSNKKWDVNTLVPQISGLWSYAY